MTVRLSFTEVQVAVAEYLRKRGVTVNDDDQVQLCIIRGDGAIMNIAGCSPSVIVNDVKLPSDGGPYR